MLNHIVSTSIIFLSCDRMSVLFYFNSLDTGLFLAKKAKKKQPLAQNPDKHVTCTTKSIISMYFGTLYY